MVPQITSQAIQHPGVAATVSGSSTLVSFFASTLPIVQWIAASVAIVVGLIAIVGAVRKYLRK
jgi:hypothetical protein